MKAGPGMTVDQFMKTVDPKYRELVQEIRRIIKETLPEAQELVKWDKPTYLMSGVNVVWIMVYRDHVNLGFFQGAKLKSKRLEGTGKGLRHVKIWRREDIDPKEFSRLLKEAAELAGTEALVNK